MHYHSHHHEIQVPSALKRALGITLIFMLIELAGGYWANSLALISDGAHMLTDVGAMCLSLFAYWIARQPSAPHRSFGYQRVEILGALISGLAIWLIAGALVYAAVMRMLSPPEVNGPIVFSVACVGLVANFLSMKFLRQAQEHNLNVRAAYVHLFADSLGSVGAVVAGAVLWVTHWRPIDPMITMIFSALMFVSSWELVKESVGILMEFTPPSIDSIQVKEDLQSIPGVEDVHDLHIWTVTSGKLALSVHLISQNAEEVLARAHEVLQKQHQIIHTTIQVEHPSKFSSERCYDCVPS